MSAIGDRTAVVSLGVSCQTAWQINRHVGLLSRLAGEALRRVSTPFDWLIMPPGAFVSWMEAGARFPASPDEIVVHPNFRWPRHNLHFWHEFTQDGVPALHATFARTRAKFDHLLDRLAAIRTRERRLFFVSNTQGNLDEVERVSPTLDFAFTQDAMGRLERAVRTAFGQDSEVHFVARADRLDLAGNATGFNVHVLEPGASDVFGSDADWEAVFRAALDRGVRQAA